MSPRVTVFFRFDDYAESSPQAVEAGLVAALARHQTPMTFGVIPAITTGSYHVAGDRDVMQMGTNKSLFLRQAVDAGTVDAALHGWNHRTVAQGPPHTEFSGLSIDEQTRKIAEGKGALGRHLASAPSVFIPPWNSYDATTLKALAQEGLAGISANRYGPSGDERVRFAPITADLRELRQAVEAARQSGDPDPIVGVLLHPYDFAESGDARGDFSCEKFDADLEWLSSQADVRVVSVAQLLNENASMDAARYRANQPSPLEAVAPPFVRATVNTPFYLTASGARRANRQRTLATIATHAAGVLIGILLGRAGETVLASPSMAVEAGRYAIGAAFLLIAGRALFQRQLGFRPMLALSLLGGMLLSAWL